MQEYDKYIDLDNVTLEDCMRLHSYKNMITVINDGHIIGFLDQEE